MNDDIKHLVPGRRPCDIRFDDGNRDYSRLTLTGRVLAVDGTPRRAPLLGSIEALDVPAGRVEWLARRTDISPQYLADSLRGIHSTMGQLASGTVIHGWLRGAANGWEAV